MEIQRDCLNQIQITGSGVSCSYVKVPCFSEHLCLYSALSLTRHVPWITSGKMSPFQTGYSPPSWLLRAPLSHSSSLCRWYSTIRHAKPNVRETLLLWVLVIWWLLLRWPLPVPAGMFCPLSFSPSKSLSYVSNTKFNMNRWYSKR